MSLFDISKDDQFRSLPRPNANDLIQNRLAHGTTQNHQAGEEVSPDGLKFRERQLLAQQDGDNKAVFGFLESTNKFGLKVAKAGYDVLTATDSQLIFNSEQNVFKIVQTGTTSVTVPAGYSDSVPYTASVAHGLGVAPAILAYVQSTSAAIGGAQGSPLPVIVNTSFPFAYAGLVDCSVTTTTVVFTVAGTVAGQLNGIWTFRYYLLQETAT